MEKKVGEARHWSQASQDSCRGFATFLAVSLDKGLNIFQYVSSLVKWGYLQFPPYRVVLCNTILFTNA